MSSGNTSSSRRLADVCRESVKFGPVLDFTDSRCQLKRSTQHHPMRLIRQCFPGRSDLFGSTGSKPSPGSVPADLTPASDLAFVFNASWVRPECCVDPLRPPRLNPMASKSKGAWRQSQCNDGVRAWGINLSGGGPQSVTRSHGHGFGVFRSE